ncbi:MAG: insulinase family protein [Anaerolineales bacterium]|nr:insulinase family protein [Anaerolineales bacterium]
MTDSNRTTLPSIPGPHDVVRHELDNGATILVRENHASPSVVIDGLLRAGAADTAPEKAGLASFTAAALLRGAGKRIFSQIFEDMESIGASLSFSAGQHTTEFSGQCLSEDLDLLLDILRDALLAPTFPAEQLEKLRGQIITGLQIRASDTRSMARLEFFKLAYPSDHPYSRSADGTVETVSGITRQDIVSFHQQHYGAGGMIISLVGDLDPAAVVRKLDAKLGDTPVLQKPSSELPSLVPLTGVQQRYVPLPGKTQSDIVLGIPGPSRAVDDFLHARLANTILGVFGLYGRLGASVRDDQGLAYYAYSQLTGGLGPGPWRISAGVNPANVSQAALSMRDEIRRLQAEPVPPEELADNKSYLVGSLPLHLETNSGVSETLVNMELYRLGLDYLQRYPQMMMQITADQVQAAALKYLSADTYAMAVAGPPGGDE